LMFSFFFGWAFGVIGRAGRAVISFFRNLSPPSP